jgi:hypothetical protein
MSQASVRMRDYRPGDTVDLQGVLLERFEMHKFV